MDMKIYMQSIEIYGTIITTIFGGVKEAFRGNLWLIPVVGFSFDCGKNYVIFGSHISAAKTNDNYRGSKREKRNTKWHITIKEVWM